MSCKKQEHIKFSLDPKARALPAAGPLAAPAAAGPLAAPVAALEAEHNPLPELNFDQITLSAQSLGLKLKTPFFVSSMTGGTPQSNSINLNLAEAAHRQGWMLALGSCRNIIEAKNFSFEKTLRSRFPGLPLLSNLGISQLIEYTNPIASTKWDAVKNLLDILKPVAFVVHANPLQECLQQEGTAHFKGGLAALKFLVKQSPVPVVVKEVGCGFGQKALQNLSQLGLGAVDAAGLGGTHWGRVEGLRSAARCEAISVKDPAHAKACIKARAAETFANWGVNTWDVLKMLRSLRVAAWASGGMQNGLDAARGLHMGAECVGFAGALLKAMLEPGERPGEHLYKSQSPIERAVHFMSTVEYELKVAMLCVGAKDIKSLQSLGNNKAATKQ